MSKLKNGIVAIVHDYGRMHQNSFSISQIWDGIDLSKYKQHHWVESDNNQRDKEIEKKAKAIGWDFEYVKLFG
jgi:hypothetical protein